MLVCMVYGCVLTLTPHFLKAVTWRGCRECLHRTRSCCWQAKYWDCETFPGSLFAECRWRWQAPCPRMTDDGMRCIMFTVAVLIPSVLISAGSHRGQLIMSHLSHCDVSKLCETMAVWCQAFLYRVLTVEVDMCLITFYWQLEEGKITICAW